MDQSTQEDEVIHQLAVLLKKSGEKILSGKSKLSLTTKCLRLLCENFCMISNGDFNTSFEVLPGNSNRLPFVDDLQFLFDFIQKTLSLKILHGHTTVQGHASLTPFRSLKSLEIKRAPLHLIEGLQKLRSKLEVIVCTRCMQNITELFETCGGDLSSPMSWPVLHTANLAYNSIEALDASLRLLPVLEILDVSHNSISATDNYLEYLTEMSILNLGYNLLTKVPSVSISSKSKLRTLILRNNCLENLNGIDEMGGLRELDLANNCISDHTALAPLGSLLWLHILILEGNPVCFHKKHRANTVHHLHPTALKRLILDSKKVSETEYELGKKGFAEQSSLKSRQNAGYISGVTSDSAAGHSSMERSHEFTTTVDDMEKNSTDDGGPVDRRKYKKGRGKTSRRVRHVDISDTTSPGEASSDGESMSRTPVLTPLTTVGHQTMKQEIETMRDHLGADWLQRLTLQKQSINSESPRQIVTQEKKEVNDDELYLPSKTSATNTNSISPTPVLASQDETKADDARNKNIELRQSTDITETQQGSTNHKLMESEPEIAPLLSSRSDSRIIAPKQKEEANTNLVKDKPKLSQKADDDNAQSIWKRSDSEVPADYGNETEPYIVCLADDADHQLLVSLTQRYILEKDINGELTEALDIKCLLNAKVEEHSQEMISEGSAVLELNFDYLKKDRRQRRYVMEKPDLEELLSLLKPVLEAKEYWAQMVDQLSCLKCANEFSKSEAIIKLKNLHKSKDSVVTNTSVTGFPSKMFSCPSCGSDMVIELDATEVAKARGSNYTTPVGSFVSGHMSFTPLAQATPLKDLNPDDVNCVTVRTCDTHSINSDSSFQSCQTPYLSAISSGSDLAINSKASSSSSNGHIALNTNQNSKESVKGGMARSVSGTLLSRYGEAGEKRDMRKNRSSQDLKKLQGPGRRAQRLQSVESDIIVLDRQESSASGYTTGSDISVLTGSDITVFSNPSARPSVTDSDILILSSDPSRPSSLLEGKPSPTNNDITILPTPLEVFKSPSSSEASSMMGTPVNTESERTMREGLLSAKLEPKNIHSAGPLSDPAQDLSPCGSMSSKMVNSLVSSVYENVLNEGDNVDNEPSIYGSVSDDKFQPSSRPEADSNSFHSFSSGSGDISRLTTDQSNNNSGEIATDKSGLKYSVSENSCRGSPGAGNSSGMKFNYDDFTQVDHRLKLYIDMQLLQGETEEFSLVLKCGIVQYISNEEFEGLLILSTTKMYVLTVDIDMSETEPEVQKWVKVIYSQPLLDIIYVDIGLGHQSFHVESDVETSSFTFMIRDEERCQRFIKTFTSRIQATSFSSKSRLEAISKNTPSTLENLEKQVICHSDKDELTEDVDKTVSLYLLGYIRTGATGALGSGAMSPISLAVTPTHLCLATEDHRWPLPRMISIGDPVFKCTQFELKDRQKITDITSVDVFGDLPLELAVNYLDEESGEECVWRLAMETEFSLDKLLNIVSQLWEEQFGVELQINK